MAESKLMRQKHQERETFWRSLTPAQRAKRSSEMAASAKILSAAGLAFLQKRAVSKKSTRRPRRG